MGNNLNSWGFSNGVYAYESLESNYLTKDNFEEIKDLLKEVELGDKYLKSVVYDQKNDDIIFSFSNGDDIKFKASPLFNNYTTKEDVESAIKEIIGTAPEAFDTLGEIADALSKGDDVVKTINGVLETKATKEELGEVSDSLDKLSETVETLSSTSATAAELGEVKAELEEKFNDYQPKGDYLTEHQDLSDYALKSEIPSLEAYATTAEVTELLQAETEDMATMTWVNSQNFLTEHQDLSEYAKTEEVTSAIEAATTGLASEEWVNSQNFLTEHQDLAEYAKTEEVETLLAAKADKEEVEAALLEKLDNSVYDEDKATFLTKDEAEATYQEKGDFLTTDAAESLASKTELATEIAKCATKEGLAQLATKVDTKIDEVVYEDGSIIFKSEGSVIDSIDATDFIKDGMISDVKVENGYLVITFNTDAGRDDEIKIAISDIFNAENYFTKDEATQRFQPIGDYAVLSEYDGRKILQMKNHDALGGVTTEGEGVNLAMVSKWNVADFGSTKVHLNLNTKDKVTINDDKEVATVDMIPETDGLATKDSVYTKEEADGLFGTLAEQNQLKTDLGTLKGNVETLETTKADKTEVEGLVNGEKERATAAEAQVLTDAKEYADGKFQEKGDYPVYERYDNDAQNIHKKTIVLENNDNISGKMTSGLGVNLVEVSKWDVADFGSTQLHINLNGSTERPTYNDDKEIALLSDVEKLASEREQGDTNIFNALRDAKTEYKDLIKAEETARKDAIEALETTADEKHLAIDSEIETLKGDLEESVKNVVKYTEFGGNRKTISIAKRDTISSEGVQIAMVSDYEGLDFPVVELGGQSGALVLNTNDQPVKIELTNEAGQREQHVVATVDEVEAVSTFASNVNANFKAYKNVVDAKLETLTAKDELSEILEGYATNSALSKVGATVTNVKQTLENKFNDYATKEELSSAISGIDFSDYATKEELDSAISGIDFSDYAKTADIEETYQKAGNYVEYTVNASNDNQKVITLENNQIIGAVPNTTQDGRVETEKTWVGLIELNKWNVVDLGNPYVPTNINTPKNVRPTVQEQGQSGEEAHKIAYVDDLTEFATREFTQSYVDTKLNELNAVIAALQDKVNKLSMSPAEYSTVAVSEIKKGGDITLLKDVKVESGDLTMTKKTDLDLNGHTIDAVGGTYGDSVVIGNGGDVTISNGEFNPSEKASVANASATILVKTAYESHLTLNDVKVTGIHPVYLNSANEKTTVTINGGEFYTTMPLDGVDSDHMAPSVYVGKGSSGSTIGGKVTINGGTFGQKGVVNNFLLNVEDVLRKQEGKEPRNFIEVTGEYAPKFWNFDPSNNKAEGEGTNFVADGCHVEKKQDGDDFIYTVVKD